MLYLYCSERSAKNAGSAAKKVPASQKSSPKPGQRKLIRGGMGRGRRSSLSSPSNRSPSTNLVKSLSVKLDDCRAAEKTSGGASDVSSTPVSGVGMRKGKTRIHLCQSELTGLNKMVSFLEGLPVTDRHVPHDIPAPDELLHDAKVTMKLPAFLAIRFADNVGI